jgi:shikimate dehydrogenase
MIIDQNTQLYGVVGNPIGHSLSPAIHNAAFLAGGMNAVYLAFETEDIQACLKGIKGLGIKGMSVTIPYKTEVMPFLDKVEDQAAAIGAVNTIVNRDSQLAGYNTDSLGALRALEENTELSGKRCVMIGAGGAARAIGYVLKDKGVELTIANRSVERGISLCKTLDCRFVKMEEVVNERGDILINTTPVGMTPNEESCPVPEKVLKKGMVVMDIIYNPLETRLLAMARARGCVVVNGLAMFVYQGAEQFRLWTGREAPIKIMFEAAREALNSRNSLK